MDEWTDGWMDGWLDGWSDGWMDGWLQKSNFCCQKKVYRAELPKIDKFIII